jgi:hypothetical protein
MYPDVSSRSQFACALMALISKDFLKTFTAAHTVVIKGVKMFQTNRMVEYSDLDIMQMIGRAVSRNIMTLFLLTNVDTRAAHNLVTKMAKLLKILLKPLQIKKERRLSCANLSSKVSTDAWLKAKQSSSHAYTSTCRNM